jgi:hypothetical protein
MMERPAANGMRLTASRFSTPPTQSLTTVAYSQAASLISSHAQALALSRAALKYRSISTRPLGVQMPWLMERACTTPRKPPLKQRQPPNPKPGLDYPFSTATMRSVTLNAWLTSLQDCQAVLRAHNMHLLQQPLYETVAWRSVAPQHIRIRYTCTWIRTYASRSTITSLRLDIDLVQVL